jgi:CRISPR-associated protein Cas2
MRQVFIVSYDVADPKRLRKVFRTMRGFGDHVQLSVFRCELSAKELVELRNRLTADIDHRHDQVLFVDVGPVEGRGSNSIAAIGKAYESPERCAIVV